MLPQARYSDPVPVVVSIQDVADERLVAYRDLRRGGDGSMVVEGELAVERFAASGATVSSVLATSAVGERLAPRLGDAVTLYLAPASIVRQIVGFDFHRGCLATGPRPPVPPGFSPPEFASLARLDRFTVVVAEALADPANAGAIARNAAAFGADLLIYDEAGADPWSRRAIRAAMANLFRLPVLVGNPHELVQRLIQATGCSVIAACLDTDAVPLHHFSWPDRAVLLVGNEGRGLSARLSGLADARVVIPVQAQADSLNVAAATAVLLHARDPEQK